MNVSITQNSAGTGGAAFINGERGDRVKMTNVLISANSANTIGGVSLESVPELILNKATIVDNGRDGLVHFSNNYRAVTNITNSIISDNIRLYIPEVDGWWNQLDISYTDLYSASISADDRAVVRFGSGIIRENPDFVDPEQGDYHLTVDSPCIDAGNPNSPQDPDGTRADMGAFYYNQFNSIDEGGKEIFPDKFLITSIYPNPFNSVTNISFDLPRQEYISLSLFDTYGRNVSRLFGGHQNAGHYSINMNADNLPSGLYLLQLKSSYQVFTKKVSLIK